MNKTIDYFIDCGDVAKQEEFKMLCSQNKAFVVKKTLFGKELVPTGACLDLMKTKTFRSYAQLGDLKHKFTITNKT
jgi:hypothetical protein